MKSKLLLTCTALLFCTCFLHGQSQASKVVNSGENSHSGWVQHPWQGKKVGYIGDSIWNKRATMERCAPAGGAIDERTWRGSGCNHCPDGYE